MESKKQPKPKSGTVFTGWATFNWGVCHNKVFRTRKEAQESCCDPLESWSDVKDHFMVVRVECKII